VRKALSAGRLTGVADGRLSFSDDAEEHIRHADEGSARLRRQIDEYIARKGIDAPGAEPDPAEVIDAVLPNPPVLSIDLAARGITTVIWCTGFRGGFGWVRVPNVLDAHGQPVHENGFASVPGVHFAGLPFAISRRSGTILAIAEEADLLVEDIQRRLDTSR
jgi:putative flavoprotein involved in K+ transport